MAAFGLIDGRAAARSGRSIWPIETGNRMYPKAELLFPPRLMPSLRGLRGPDWAALVERVMKLPETEPIAWPSP